MQYFQPWHVTQLENIQNNSVIEHAPIESNPNNINAIKDSSNADLGNIQNFGYVAQSAEWIVESAGSLFKMKTDGSGRTQLTNDKAEFINAADNYIYYSKTSDMSKIYKINLDGRERKKLTEDSGIYLNVVGDWIYYTNKSDMFKIYKVKLDGTGRTKVSDDTNSSLYINVVGDWIYYSNNSKPDSQGIFKIKIDGSDMVALNGEASTHVLS